MKKKYLLDTCALISLKKNYAHGHEQHIARLSSLNDDKDWESPVLNKRKLGSKAINRQSIDLLIATTAIRNKAILVTSDIMGAVIKEFCSGFRYENWMKLQVKLSIKN